MRWAIGLWYAQSLTTLAMLAMVICFDIETIVVTGPALTAIGLALTLVTRPLASWPVTHFSLSAPLMCAFGALVIAFFELRPGQAYFPILTILTTYTILTSPLALLARRRIRDWPATPRTRWVLRYNMKSLFVVMTGVSVAAAVLSYLANAALGFPIVFGTFGIIAAALPFIISWQFRADRRRPNQPMVGDGALDSN